MLEFLKTLKLNLSHIFTFNKKNSPNTTARSKGKSNTNVAVNGNGNSTQIAETINNYSSEFSSTQQPDVVLGFVYSKSPALILINQSSVVARDIKWALALWNIDLPDRNDPLPIPISTFDFLRPHAKGGPQNLFNSPQLSRLLKTGNRLFGSASIQTPDSIRCRTYVVCIEWGVSGWYAELEEEKLGELIIPSNFLKETRERYFKELEKRVPVQSRIPILDAL